MSLYFSKGAYSSTACTVRLASRRINPVIVNTFVVALEHEITFDGFLYRTPAALDGIADLSAQMAALEAAIRIPNQAVGIAYSGGITQHWLPNGGIGDVYLKSFGFQDSPLHMATEVKWNATFAATYANSSLSRNVVQLEETLSIIGEGGPITALAPQAGLPSIYQDISDFSDVQVIQAGKVTGRLSMPDMPAPLITLEGARDQRVTRNQQSRVQRGLQVLLHVREYQYTFNLAGHPGNITLGLLT